MSFPVVPLDAIPSHGLEIPLADTTAWARKACAEGLGGPVRTVGGRLGLTRHGADVGLEGEVRGGADVACDRCGAVVALDVESPVSCLYLAPRAGSSDREEAEAEAEGPEAAEGFDDLGEYDGVTFDVADAVRECFVLERPARLLCADVVPENEHAAADVACLARFKAAAGPAEPAIDPRLSLLKNFKPVD